MLVSYHARCNLDQFLVQHAFNHVCFCPDQINFVKEREFGSFAGARAKQDLLVSSCRGRRFFWPLYLLLLRHLSVRHKVNFIEVVSLPQNAQCRDVLVLAHDLCVPFCRCWNFSLAADPAHQDALHVSRLDFEGQDFDRC